MLDIIQWNIRSVLSNIDNLKSLIEEYSPSVVLLSETWLNEFWNFKVPGFHIYRQDRVSRAGGIASLIKTNISFTVINLDSVEAPDMVQFHGINLTSMNLTIINIYSPPHVTLPTSFWNMLLSKISQPFLICGDLNAQNPSWGSGMLNLNGKIVAEFLLSNDICLLNDGSPTRVTAPGKNLSAPDLALSSSDLRINSKWRVISDPGNSDHLPILISLNPFQHSLPTSRIRFSTREYNLSQADWCKYQETIANGIQSRTPNTLKEFCDLIKEAADSSIPKKKPPKPTTYRKSWWNVELSEAVKKRSEAFKMYLRNPTTEQYLHAKNIQAAVKNKIRNAKRESFRAFCENLSTRNGAKLWSDIAKFQHGCKPPATRVSSTTCGQKIIDRLCPPQNTSNIQTNIPEVYRPLPFPPITLDELILCINSKKESCPGKDGISYGMLKSLPIQAKELMTQIFNNLFENPYIPLSLKDTVVVPICKPNKSPDDPLSYRPIALTSCILKILESLLATRLERIYQQSTDNRELQFGFRKGKSVNDALAYLVASMYSAFSRNEVVIIVFLDIKQAYDSVRFDLLENTLRSMKVPLPIIQLLRSLTVHTNIFLVDPSSGELIGPKQSNIGLLQGSPKNPTLFNCFVGDLQNCIDIPGVTVLKYADDSTIISTGASFKVAFEKMTKALKCVERWANTKSLQLSPEKSSALCCNRSNAISNIPSLNMFQQSIPWTKTVKYLGVTIHQSLDWSQHIHNMCSKSLQGINVMRALCRTWWGSHPSTQLLLYKATVRPFLDYGAIFYGKCQKALLNKLDRVQYSALRTAMGYMKSTPIPVIMMESNELPLKYRRLYLATKFVTKLHRISNDPVLNKILSLKNWTSAGNPPPIIESFSLINNSESFYSSYQLPCFSHDLTVHSSFIPYINFGLSKDSPDNSLPFTTRCSKDFPDHIMVFTDASKTPTLTGIGIYSPVGISMSQKIPDHFSICSAELIAILEATREIKRKNLKRCLIISDSMSALEKISKWRNSAKNDHITLAIRANLLYLSDHGFSIKLIWIPSHTNIQGNDMADNLAKQGSEESVIKRADISDFWPRYKRIVWERWREEWKVSIGNRTFSKYVHIGSFGVKPWFKGIDLSRGNIVTMNRLRSEHCCTPSHLMRIHVVDSDLCGCGERGDIPHIFFNCRDNMMNCSRLYDDLINTRRITNFPLNIYDLIFSNDITVYILLYNFLLASKIKL